MYEHVTSVRVRYAETDQMDIVYYGNYAQYFEVGRAECIRELGFTYKKMEEMGVRMPVVSMEAEFLRPAHYDDLITIKTLLKELHHRVKNNLQVIGSMLNLQSAKLPDGQARSAIEEGKARVEAISLLHQLMYFDDKLSGIDMEKYLTALIDMLTNSFGYQGSGN